MSLLRNVQRVNSALRTVVSEPVGQELRESKISARMMSAMSFHDFEPILRRAFARFGCEFTVVSAGKVAACGAKIMYNQLPNSSFGPSESSRATIQWLLSRKVRFVHLIRQSHARKVLSNFRLSSTGIAHNRGDRDTFHNYQFASLSIDPIKVLRSIQLSVKASVAHRFELRRTLPSQSLLEIYYEDLLSDSLNDSTSTISNLLAFISPVSTDFRKYIHAATTDIMRNPRHRCSELLVSWPTVVEGLQSHIENLKRSLNIVKSTAVTQDQEDEVQLLATQIGDLEFSISDCSLTDYDLTIQRAVKSSTVSSAPFFCLNTFEKHVQSTFSIKFNDTKIQK